MRNTARTLANDQHTVTQYHYDSDGLSLGDFSDDTISQHLLFSVREKSHPDHVMQGAPGQSNLMGTGVNMGGFPLGAIYSNASFLSHLTPIVPHYHPPPFV